MKKIISILLTVAVVMSAVPLTFAQSGNSSIIISDDDDLKAVSNRVLESNNGLEGITLILNADLDLGGIEWNSYIIGTEEKPFRGVFDGNGHIISNFKLIDNSTENARYGLFGVIGGNAVVKNLGVKNIVSLANSLSESLTYPGSWHAGIVAVALDNAKVERCFAKNYTINTKTEDGTKGIQPSGAGSIIGLVNGAGVVVSDCYQYGWVEYNDSVGTGHGLIGGVAEGMASAIRNCYSDEAVATCYSADKSKFVNCYAVKTTGWSMYGTLPGITITLAQLSGITASLGGEYIADVYSTNNGYPMLSWELELTPLTGDGTIENPYMIVDTDTLAQAALHTNTEGKYYKMANNIDFDGEKLSSYIGSVANPFKGVFDGDGHIIKNYTIKAPVSGMLSYMGIFAAIGGEAVVKNVGVENVTVTNEGEWGYNSRVGGLVAMMYDNATVTNCYARNVTFDDTSGGSFAVVYGGGLVGNMVGDGATVTNCYATGVNETSAIVGSLSGLAGSADNFDLISNCYSDTTLTMVKVSRLSDVTNSYCAKDDDGSALMRAGELVGADSLKGKAEALGSAFIEDENLINNGYPILAWEANVTADKSTNANLKSITVSSGTLAPEFAADTKNYTVSVENSVETITISAEAEHELASVSGQVTDYSLEIGANVFEIVVTAELTYVTKTYKVTVTRLDSQGGGGAGGGGDENPEQPAETVAISSAADLEAFATAVKESSDGLAGKVYVLKNDIDLGGEMWTTIIGVGTNVFKGTFDGKGHKISNFSFEPEGWKDSADIEKYSYGLFGRVGGNAVIKNVGIEDVEFVNTKYNWGYGGFCGGLVASLEDNASVIGCYAKNITVNTKPDSSHKNQPTAAGGLVGRADGAGVVIKNCYGLNLNEINDSAAAEGAVVGTIVNISRMENCYSDTVLGATSAEHDSATRAKVVNSYCTEHRWFANVGRQIGTVVTADELKGVKLGNYFAYDKNSVNDRLPVLAWERDFDIITNVTKTATALSSVTIDKFNDSAGKVIVAAYDSDGKLLDTVIADVSVKGGVITVSLDISGANTVKAYILKSDGEATPISVVTTL